jgi:sarcosine oxidase delta subunit
MKCPKCGTEIKDEGRAKGGRKSRRTISAEEQAKMQEARKLNKERENEQAEHNQD